jgi:hypothetical protein
LLNFCFVGIRLSDQIKDDAFSLINLFTVSMTRYGDGTNQLVSDDQLNLSASMPLIPLHQNFDIHETCVENDISISSQCIPRESNKEADSLSRMNDCDDWGIQT